MAGSNEQPRKFHDSVQKDFIASLFQNGHDPQLASSEYHPEYASRRSPLLCTRGLVASSQPLASEAGLRVLREGGNAADAAVAMAAALNVCEPCSTGLGGDAFVLWYDAKRQVVECIQGNGRSPAALTLDLVKQRGFSKTLPPGDALTVTVPGSAAAWADTIYKYGCLSLAQVLAPAIELAEGGWAVGPITAAQWAKFEGQLKSGGDAAKELLFKSERAPRAGEVMTNLNLAKTLRALAEHGRDGFYKGHPAKAIVEVLAARGGVLTLEDLEKHESTFHPPICTSYRGLQVWEVPPPTHGVAALCALNTLEALGDLGAKQWGSVDHQHAMIEAMRLAFVDSLTHVADTNHHEVPLEELLSKGRAKQQAAKIDMNKAAVLEHVKLDESLMQQSSDTVFFCAVDAQGNGCSMINSNYMGFGTGIVPPGCGFTLQNRGHNFSLDANHPNCIAPNKRPYHTIIPGLSTFPPPEGSPASVGALHSVFGVMGGFMQPQGHVQVISNMVDHHLDPQKALDRPRFCLTGLPCLQFGHGPHPLEFSQVSIEDRPGVAELASELERRGHNVKVVGGLDKDLFGRGQIILRDPRTGVLCGGSEGRADGCAMGF